MELFDTHFVQFGQVLAVLVRKMVKSQLHLDYFQNTHSKMKTKIRL